MAAKIKIVQEINISFRILKCANPPMMSIF